MSLRGSVDYRHLFSGAWRSSKFSPAGKGRGELVGKSWYTRHAGGKDVVKRNYVSAFGGQYAYRIFRQWERFTRRACAAPVTRRHYVLNCYNIVLARKKAALKKLVYYKQLRVRMAVGRKRKSGEVKMYV